ncbi:hypothetical protein BRC94_02485 [Halobacteriales archaeon QS_5_70_17]|jgi:predicted ester cyclase|nr:MAG: hypothetical protein BRC94_02485 [Halobacteriales archaeon QS_5_70_17]
MTRRPDLERVSRRDFEEVWHGRDPSAIPGIYRADYVGNGFPVVGSIGRGHYRRLAELFLRAFPDIRFRIHELDSAGRSVGVRWTFTATHAGRVFGLPPSGATLEVDGRGRHRYDDGRVAETWLEMDWAGLASGIARGYASRLRERLGGLVR